MNSPDRKPHGGQDKIEAILKTAAPRPAPPAADEQVIREAVRAEWQSVVAQRRGRMRRWQLAAAASVLVAIVALVTLLPTAPTAPVEVAGIEKSNGTIYRLIENAELVELPDAQTVFSGQVIETASDGSLGLNWNKGGSLRIDRDTRVEFPDAGTAHLHRGRIYFDSGSGSGESRLIVTTDQGSIMHIGTQFMAEVSPTELVVSVREGKVRIDSVFHDSTAQAGEQLRMRGSAQPVTLDIPTYGDLWTWTEATSPGIDLKNRSAHEFLNWISRQTGHEIVFDTPAAEQLALDTILVGRVEADPRTELRLRMMTTDLEYTFDSTGGKIHVRIAANQSP